MERQSLGSAVTLCELYLPTGPLVMATADDREDAQRGMDAIADAARLVYQTLSPESVLAD